MTQLGVQHMCSVKTVEPKTDSEGFTDVPPSKTCTVKNMLPEVVGKIENAKFFKVPKEETHERFVFQSDESLYQTKSKSTTRFR